MSVGRTLYLTATGLGAPLVPALLKRRADAGKEAPERLNERVARDLPARPQGPLVWMHGASVGECRLLLGVVAALRRRGVEANVLLTSQTLTSAAIVASAGVAGLRHQMAPVDTPAGARRFLAHWHPDLAVFAEGEIWPNLLGQLKRSATPALLVNARMTPKSRRGWTRFAGTAREVFSAFDVILAADEATAQTFQALAPGRVSLAGNLKAALPPPPVDDGALALLRREFIGSRRCLVAASTHEGEEALVLSALERLAPRPALVLVPRHPERGDALAALLRDTGLTHARHSRGERAGRACDVLLADTLGEMGLWYRLADLVYLGGGHAAGVGGHNPVEPVQLGTPVVSGPDVFNFSGVMAPLCEAGAVRLAPAGELVSALRDGLTRLRRIDPQAPVLRRFFSAGEAPLARTLDAIVERLPAEARP